jgi:hypothetical protein
LANSRRNSKTTSSNEETDASSEEEAKDKKGGKGDKRSYNILPLIMMIYLTLASSSSYPVFTPKPSTHRMHDPGSIVPHIQPKGFTDNQMSQIKYDYYYINSVSKGYDDSWWNGITEDSKTP